MGKTTEKITDSMKNKLMELYKEGKMDTEIASILGVTSNAIFYWRKKLNLKSTFTYSKISKIDKDKFEELFNQNLNDYSIAEKMNISSSGVYYYRIKHNYHRDSLTSNKAVNLTEYQKQVLLGTLLGDSSLRKIGNGNITISCAHGIKQKDYCLYKTDIFKSLGAHCNYHKRSSPDKRNNIYYEDYTMYVPANPVLEEWYEHLYKQGSKVIPFSLFKYFTEVSLAFMFMDDGSKASSGYTIATNCFNKDELLIFRKFLLNRFNLETSLFKSKVLYIRAVSKKHFTELISPYIYDCMKYKI